MTRPRLLDLFCGAGGAGMGYHLAGFEVVGVDIRPQPRYPFEFIQADAMKYDPGTFVTVDAVHASPPCQRYSRAVRRENRSGHPDLLAAVRAMLIASGHPWVIENVPGAPMRPDLKLCGCMFGLGVMRERWFETSWGVFDLRQSCYHPEPVVNTMRPAHGPWYRKHGRSPYHSEIAVAMGVEWMRGDEITQAIPPAYTEHIGRELLACIREVTAP